MKKRRLNTYKVFSACAVLCLFLCVTLLLTSLAIRGHNSEINAKIISNKKEIVRLQSEVDIVTAQVKELTSYQQVVELINEKEMKVSNGTSIDLMN